MKAAEKRDKFLTAGVMHRQLERGLDRFGTTVGKVRFGPASDRDDLIQLFAEIGHLAVIKIRAAHVNELFSLLGNGFYDLRMAMAGGAYGHAGVAIEKNIAVHVFDPHAVSALGDEFVVRAGIRGVDVHFIGFNDLAAFGA